MLLLGEPPQIITLTHHKPATKFDPFNLTQVLNNRKINNWEIFSVFFFHLKKEAFFKCF